MSCKSCNNQFYGVYLENNRCINCINKDKMDMGCIFCENDVYKCSFICNICSRFVCRNCWKIDRYIKSNNFTGCINCLITKSQYFDYLARKTINEIKERPEEIIKYVLTASGK